MRGGGMGKGKKIRRSGLKVRSLCCVSIKTTLIAISFSVYNAAFHC